VLVLFNLWSFLHLLCDFELSFNQDSQEGMLTQIVITVSIRFAESGAG